MIDDAGKKFPQKDRIRRGEDFQKMKRLAVRVRGRLLTVSFLPGDAKRLGLVATKKLGNAVSRNRLKRVVRDFFRLHKKDLPLGDVVVVFGAESGDAHNSEIREDLSAALQRLKAKVV